MTKPQFLQLQHKDGASIVAAFRRVSHFDAKVIDAYLLHASQFGSMTWQEKHLFEWINESNYI